MENKENNFYMGENTDVTEVTDENNEIDEHTHTHAHGHSHEHSRHGHHSHHSHRSSSKHRRSSNKNKKNKEKFKNFIQHNKKRLIYLAVAIIMIACLIVVGVMLDRKISFLEQEIDKTSGALIASSANEIQISVPFFEEDVVIVGPAVDEFMKADSNVSVKDIYRKYASVSERLDIGLPVEISYEIKSLPKGFSVKNAEYIVADNAEFNSPIVFNTDGKTTKVDVFHLKTGTKYFYQINLTFNNDKEATVGGTFKTSYGPRVLTVSGVYNLRDIGGIKTSDGRTIKQGLLYRGCEIDGAVEKKYSITPEGLNTMLTVLGIKTDMDLRLPSDNKYGTDALGAGVKHEYYSSPMYANIFHGGENAEKVRAIFSDLADPDNYPIYLHCTYGQDRTGTICYLLECLLGVDEASMMKDYQLSGLHHGDVSSEAMSDFVDSVKALPGYTMTQKIEGWLLSIGVTQAEIDSIRDIFVD